MGLVVGALLVGLSIHLQLGGPDLGARMSGPMFDIVQFRISRALADAVQIESINALDPARRNS